VVLQLDSYAEMPPSYNIAPTQILVAREHDGKREAW